MENKEIEEVETNIDTKEALESLATSVFQQYVNTSETPSQGSILLQFDVLKNETENHCVFCGKSLTGHFEDGTFKTRCDCKGAEKEHDLLLRLKSLEDEKSKIEKEILSLSTLIKNNSYKHAIPYIIKNREEASCEIEKALNAFKDSH